MFRKLASIALLATLTQFSGGIPAAANTECDEASQVWPGVKNSKNPAQVNAFISVYSDCKLQTSIAQRYLQQLGDPASTPKPATEQTTQAPAAKKPAPKPQAKATTKTAEPEPKTETPAPKAADSSAACDGQALGPLVVTRKTEVFDGPGGKRIKSLNTGAVLLQGYGIQGGYAVYRTITLGRGKCLYAKFDAAKPNIQKLH
ncbi:MAG: hypothetical protein ACU0BB_13630 [Paracoccaceae bacterium]